MAETIKIPFRSSLTVTGIKNNVCWVTPSDYNNIASVSATSSVIYGTNWRNWSRRIARGMETTTLAFFQKQELTSHESGLLSLRQYCNSGAVKGWQYYEYAGLLDNNFSYTMPPIPSFLLDPKTDQLALVKFQKEARKAQTQFQGSTFIAELRDTIHGIRNPAKGLRDAIDSWHKHATSVARRAGRGVPKKKAPSVVRRALASEWLEFTFGVMPLINDVQDGYRGILRLSRKAPWSGIDATEESRTIAASPLYFTRSFYPDTTVYLRRDAYTVYFVRYYGAVKISVDSFRSRAIEEAGLRFRDFLPAVWEAIPYSFLVDYFSNVGDLVEAASFPWSDIKWASRVCGVSNEIERRSFAAKTVNQTPGGTSWSGPSTHVPWSIKARGFNAERHINPALSLDFRKALHIGVPTSTKKWLNIGALATLKSLPS